MKFTELNLPDLVQQGVVDAGFESLTPVQEESIPLALAGKDVAAQAQTGTGKTAAFLISLFCKLLASGKRTSNNPRALVMAPTRELVVQICKDAETLGRHTGLKVQPIFGGVDYEKQRNALKDGVDIIVATPGRLIDYFKQRVFSMDRVEALVIDEADRMFDMGFIKDLRYILRKLPPFEKRQTMLFSATLSAQVMELAYEFMDLAEKVQIEPEQVAAEKIDQILYHVSRKEKFALLLGLLKKESGVERVMLFVNTKAEAERLNGLLNANEVASALLSGDIPQKKRMRILDQFKLGSLTHLVATDVASRGIHVDNVTHVINYDLPQDREDYVHRIGRTARAGATGRAISFADEETVYQLADIEDYLGEKVPSEMPLDEDFCFNYKRAIPKRKKPPEKKPAGDGQKRRRRRRPRRRPGGKPGENSAGDKDKSSGGGAPAGGGEKD
ncbi:ATP-dependent RNA helicase RhlB [Malonomonas rubra DSM 5091]|uniref:ATP-dependent RNA helicase RhlB n=1 Tax=Malonomonas rubra DSM 5091 TaxID=1122189 RepID=A0A1M6F282_MALRU|nr:DEAD/DEAH box helicase [Malonomonas rubra]SHI91780.1 ATP-dependent RNA helicase RhlB [Malonomonas rubra DSM 5091]